VDFPAGLPAPEIDPTLLHECGDILAIRHVPGANLTVFSDGADPRTVVTSTGWTAMRPAARPFALAHRFTAQAELCGNRSPISAEERPVPPPSVIPAPTLNPPAVYAGQELVNVETITYGATVNVSEATAGGLSAFSWPVSWYPDYDVATRLGRPLAAGDQLIIVQGLCDRGDPLETGEVARCEELPAPRIRLPQAGATFVVITESATGARIRVYDAAGIEIGDGAGTVILLSRTITAADTLTVVQQLGECTSGTGYRVSVRIGPPRQDR
jgi:hypothetical protein